jgi:nucleoside phosphorylase
MALQIAEIRGKELYNVAVVRTAEQEQVANYLINDLNPSCLVLVGIGGAKPESEFTLGDVVVATRLHDFSVRAALPDGQRELTNIGGPAHLVIQRALANLRAVEGLLRDWNSREVIGLDRPPVSLDDDNFLGDDEWKKRVKRAVSIYFGPEGKERQPIVTAAAVAAGNVLMKDPGELSQWLDHARDLKAVEMELPGVYQAAAGIYPVLAIRGISDIVGFKRDSAWTEYACQTAASFAYAYLASGQLNIPAKSKNLSL